jgi:hypothetical protein
MMLPIQENSIPSSIPLIIINPNAPSTFNADIYTSIATWIYSQILDSLRF